MQQCEKHYEELQNSVSRMTTKFSIILWRMRWEFLNFQKVQPAKFANTNILSTLCRKEGNNGDFIFHLSLHYNSVLLDITDTLSAVFWRKKQLSQTSGYTE